MRKRRLIAKGKVYGFSPWVDQVDAINRIMDETGEKKESVLLRNLVEEALVARRRKNLSVPTSEESHTEGDLKLETIESLLMRLAREEEISLRVLDVCLALLQAVLVETHATRRISWESLVMPKLQDKGVDANELERRFMRQADEAKDYAYGIAQRIKQSQEAPK